jgi:gliding motility-associated-like protein
MKKTTLILLLFFSSLMHAQLIVDNSETPVQLVEDVLIGEGVTPINIKFNGNTLNASMIRDQATHFTTNFNPTNLGISEGLLLSTGKGFYALGPNTSHNNLATGQNQSGTPGGSDPDLVLLSGSTISSSAVLEFDFLATGLELNFDFVFGSEEYAGYVNSINDSFGFFLSGYGIAGPYSNGAKNIALVPNTNTQISINTINNGPNNNGTCTNCAYYINNGPTGQNPANPSAETIEYDGFTTVLRATSALRCGEMYHIKLAIGNVSDDLLDSGVFLKNFRIKPMELLTFDGLNENLSVCYGQSVLINSGVTQGTNVFIWKKDGVVIAGETGTSITATDAGTYSLTINTDYGCQIAHDEIILAYLPQIAVTAPTAVVECTNLPGPYEVDLNAIAANMLGSSDPIRHMFTFYDDNSLGQADNGTPNNVIAQNAGGTWDPFSLGSNSTDEIWVRVDDLFTLCGQVFHIPISFTDEPSGNISFPNSPYCDQVNTPQAITQDVTPGGVYSATPAGLNIDPATGAINPSLSTPGNYTVNYNLAAIGNCPAFSPTPTTVSIVAVPAAPVVTTPITYCQNETAVALTAPGSNLLWYTDPTTGTGSATAPTPSTISAGSTTYYVSESAGTCEGPRAAIVVNVNPTPAAPTVAPVTYCQNATPSVLTATGANLLWYTSATTGIGSTTAPTPTTTAAGLTNYYVSQTVNNCESPRANIGVMVYATPALPTVTTPVTYCQNATPTALTAAGTGILWYTDPVTGVGNPIAPTPITTSAGTTTYYASQTINGCEGPRAAIVVNVNATPAAPSVTTPITYCQSATASALTATGANLLWYADATTATGSATAPTPSTTTSGATDYYVSQTINGCEGPRAIITVDVLPTPAAPTVTAVTYCQNDSALALTATGSNLLWYTNSTTGTGSATAPTPTTTASGVTNYYVSQTINGCEGPRATLPVMVYATPALPTVTSPIGYCQNGIATSLSATGTGLLWYTTPSLGTGSATAPIPSTVTAGATTYYVSQTINGCEGPRAAIVVNVTPTPIAPTTAPITYCQNATALPLTAMGSNLLWYTNPLSGTGTATAPTPSTLVPGITSYYVSQTVNGCESLREILIVDILPTPTAPTVSPISYCQNASAVALTATGSNLLWYTAPTNGVGSATAPTPATATAGVTNYYVSQTINGCEGPRAQFAVTVYATPALPTVTTPVTYCQNYAAAPLTATGSNLLWYTAPSSGTGSATAPTPSTLAFGNTTYYVSQTINGCEGPRAAIVVNITGTPAAPIVTSPITYCKDATPSVLTATGTNLLWYTDPTTGTGSPTAPTPTTAVAGTTTYYVSQSNGCESPRAAIVVTVLALPGIPTVNSVSYCQNATPSALTAGGSNLLWYANATTATGSTTAPTPITTTAGTTSYYVSQTVNGCEGPRGIIMVTVYATPALPTVTTPVTYCQNYPAAPLSAGGTGLLWYTSATSGTGSATVPAPSTATAGNTSYYVSQTINGCEGPRAEIVVTINPTPTAPIVAPIAYCENEASVALTASGANLLWYSAATSTTGSSSAPTPSTATAGATNYYVSQTVNGCESPRSLIVVTVHPNPLPAPQDGVVCIDENHNVTNTVTLDSGLTGNYTYEWFTVSGTVNTPIVGANQSTYVANAADVYGVRVTNSVTGCQSGVVTATVGISPFPTYIGVNATEYFEDDQRITVEVLPQGNYQYQLDNGAIQSENIFVDVPPGTYQVHIKSECGDYVREVTLMDFPRFFTPNGDGYHDNWNIFSLSGQANAKIYIFDRLGKLLKEISPSGAGWDGKFNGQDMPSSDYWFIVHYEDQHKVNKIFKSHFAIKR